MPLPTPLNTLIALGVPARAAMSEKSFRGLAQDLVLSPGDVLVIHPSLVPPSALTPLLTRDGKAGFVVVDLSDLDAFAPIEGVEVPDAPLYVMGDPQRGDEYRNQSPDEVAPQLAAAGRTPLTISEGISWLLQAPDMLQPNHCFMTTGSRIRGARGRLDARTPAVWISGGTGRDGRSNRGAPKVGWCWAGNRHTWLGIASAASRR